MEEEPKSEIWHIIHDCQRETLDILIKYLIAVKDSDKENIVIDKVINFRDTVMRRR